LADWVDKEVGIGINENASPKPWGSLSMLWRAGSYDFSLGEVMVVAMGMKGAPTPAMIPPRAAEGAEEGIGMGVCVGDTEELIIGEGLGLVDWDRGLIWADLGLSMELGLDEPECECGWGMSECMWPYGWFNRGDRAFLLSKEGESWPLVGENACW
jgi:hypothetical protein